MKYLFICVFLTSSLWSDDRPKSLAGFDPKTDIIADNYEAGAFLIYDCVEKHWTCVAEPYFKDCQDKRVGDSRSTSLFHSCAPIAELPTKKSCFQRQLFMISQNHGFAFCVKDQWKEKSVEY